MIGNSNQMRPADSIQQSHMIVNGDYAPLTFTIGLLPPGADTLSLSMSTVDFGSDISYNELVRVFSCCVHFNRQRLSLHSQVDSNTQPCGHIRPHEYCPTFIILGGHLDQSQQGNFCTVDFYQSAHLSHLFLANQEKSTGQDKM